MNVVEEFQRANLEVLYKNRKNFNNFCVYVNDEPLRVRKITSRHCAKQTEELEDLLSLVGKNEIIHMKYGNFANLFGGSNFVWNLYKFK